MKDLEKSLANVLHVAMHSVILGRVTHKQYAYFIISSIARV